MNSRRFARLLFSSVALGLLLPWPLCGVKTAAARVPAATGVHIALPRRHPLRLVVGGSAVIESASPLARVLVSNPKIVAAVAVSPRQVVIEARKAGSCSLILWSRDGRFKMMPVQVDLGITALRRAIHRAWPNVPVRLRADRNRIVLAGQAPDAATAKALEGLAHLYAAKVVDTLQVGDPPPRRQILLKVRFVEVDRAKLNQFGVNLISTGAGNTPGVISTQQFGTIAGEGGQPLKVTGTIDGHLQGYQTQFGVNNLLNFFFFRPDLNLGATLALLQQKNILQILAQPNLMALDGAPASFLAGGEIPVPVVQGGVNVGAVTIIYRPFGVRLNFQGTIEPGRIVRLQVKPEVSTLDYANAVNISGFTVPAFSTRSADSVIELKDGQAFGIAGLLDQRVTADLRKMPGIANIPILGHLFRSHSLNRSRTELMVMVQPFIVDPAHTGASAPSLPAPALPYLNPQKYDRHLPGHASQPGRPR